MAAPNENLPADKPSAAEVPVSAQSKRKEQSKRTERQYKSRADVSLGLEQLMAMGLSGLISLNELKAFQGTLKSIAENLPKEDGAAAVPICERLKDRMRVDPELLEDLSVVFPREQLEKILRGKS